MRVIGFIHPCVVDRLDKKRGEVIRKCAFEERISAERNDSQTLAVYVEEGDGHSFAWAMAKLRAGEEVTRAGWNAPGQWVAVCEPDDKSDMDVPYCYLHNAQGKNVPWTPSQGDLFADDWRLA
jgi:hypothetical protein